jgi:chemotaxis protein histidine kinase CheA/ActR/RegA family two-component response regulator
MARADLDDLLPLFLEEAGSRLERLSILIPGSKEDPAAAVQVRREIHALKGAARLMGLPEIAEICHQAEDRMIGDSADADGDLPTLIGRVVEIVENLRSAPENDRALSPEKTEQRSREQVIRGGSGEIRVASEFVDALAERSARMRITARSGNATVQRLFDLATLAERGRVEGSTDVLTDLGASLRRAALELENTTKTLQSLSEEQLDATLKLQVRPLRPFLRTLARHTREVAQSLGKDVQVTTSGGHVQLDRRILAAIRETALHLAHNAVDHGIEDAEERTATGKSPRGSVHFSAETDGDRVRLVVSDDGRGIEPDEVVRVAVERGLVKPSAAAHLTDSEAFQLLELPGFTTREHATDVSGRGIGLDAVTASFRNIGGDLWIRSTPGEGTRVTAQVPVARRGERVLVVRVGSLVLALPSAAVRSFSRLTPEILTIEDGRPMIRHNGGSINAVFLAPIFNEPEPTRATLVEMNIGGRITAVIVDVILGEEEVFVRPLPSVAGAPPTVEGIALLSSGLPVGVLSLQRLGPLELGEIRDPHPESVEAGSLRVLLTDDTQATREMLRRLLEDAGFFVQGVETAEEALRRIEEEPYDCVLTGVDLPGLSGIDLTRRVRSSDLYSDLPVVVISTRDRPADRLEGLEAGADAYLVKQRMEPEHLASLIRRITRDSTDATK